MTRSGSQQDRSSFRAHRSTLVELPPSAKLVAMTLDRSAALPQGQIAEETLLPDRTVRYALNRLDEAGLIETEFDLSDARRQLYSLRPPE